MSENATRGLLGSERIPVPDASQISAAYCLRLLYLIRDVVFSTVDAEGLPASRVIDVMYADEQRLYFLAPRGKAFYAQLIDAPYVAITGQTTDFRTCRLRGPVVHPSTADEQRNLVNWLFDLNPDMNELYPGDSRSVIEVFYLEEGEGEYYDLGQKPLFRTSFRLGESGKKSAGNDEFYITDACAGCGMCADACPQGCIATQSDGMFEIAQSACLRCGICFERCPSGAIAKRCTYRAASFRIAPTAGVP